MLQRSVILLFYTLSGISSEESNQRSSVLTPRNFNHHAHDGNVQNRLLKPKPTKQGPVLFPNDGPPPPKTPLIVTSRPLVDQLTKNLNSNSNPELNNTLTSPSYINQKYEPNYLARFNLYKPIPQIFTTQNPLVNPSHNFGHFSGNDFDDNHYNFDDYSGKTFNDYSGTSVDFKHPYAEVVKKSRLSNEGFDNNHRYNDFEERTVLPPIYKALADHAEQNVLNIKKKKASHKQSYKVKEPDYTNHYGNDVDSGNNDVQEQNQNYAFSYTVRDHKTGDDFSHSQHSTGSATNGEYRVRLPDGRMQIVSYTADENGYKADVRYDDEHVDQTANAIDYSRNNLKNKSRYNTASNTPIDDEIYNRHTDAYKEFYNDDNSYDYNKFYDTPYKSKYDFDTKENPDTKLGVIIVPNYQTSTKKPLFLTRNPFNGVSSTVKPSYEELKPLFVTRKPNTPSSGYYNKIPVEINVPSTTANPLDFQSPTTERVVVIGASKQPFYTNIGNGQNQAKISLTTPKYFYTPTPSVQIISTANPYSVNKNVDVSSESKAILSDSFINRINRYLNFK